MTTLWRYSIHTSRISPLMSRRIILETFIMYITELTMVKVSENFFLHVPVYSNLLIYNELCMKFMRSFCRFIILHFEIFIKMFMNFMRRHNV